MCLGDRFEMAASVVSVIPLNKIHSLHCGETSLGALITSRDIISSSSLIHLFQLKSLKSD